MRIYTFRTGPIRINREARLCRLDPTPTEDLGDRIDNLENNIKDFYKSVLDKVTGADKIEVTRNRMQDEREWIQGFRETLVDNPEAREMTPPSGKFGPADYLRHLDLPQRKIEFVKFLHAQIPDAVRTKVPPHPLLWGLAPALPPAPVMLVPIKALTIPQKDLAAYLATPGATAEIDLLVSPAIVQRLLEVQQMLIGENVTPDAQAQNLASQTVDTLYAPGKIGHIFHDYSFAISALRKTTPPPSREQMRDVNFLLEKLPAVSSTSAQRLRGYLRVMQKTGRLPEAQKRINDAADLLDKRDAEQEAARTQALHDRSVIDKGMREDLARKQRSFKENWDNLVADKPMIALGVGALAVWSLFTKKKFMGLKINTASRVFVGLWIYNTLLRGDENAFENMTSFVQKKTNKIHDTVAEKMTKARLLGLDGADRDIKQIELMTKFFNEKSFERIYPTSVAFMTMAETKIGSIADAFDAGPSGITIVAKRDAKGNDSTFKQELDKTIKDRKYDREAVYTYLTGDPEGVDKMTGNFVIRNESVVRAYASFFYTLGSKDPANREAVLRIDAARKDVATTANPSPSVFDIKDPKILAEVYRIMKSGKLKGQMPPYKDMSLVDIIAKMTDEKPRERFQIDTSQKIKDPLSFAFRQKEVALYNLKKVRIQDNPNIAPERLIVIDGLRNSYKEWTAYMKGRGILEGTGEARLNARFEEILATPETPLAQLTLSVDRLKYLTLVAAMGSTTLPLNEEAVDTRVVPKIVAGPGIVNWIKDNTADILQRLNRNLLISPDATFHEINNLKDVLAVLQDNYMSIGPLKSLNKTGFDYLRKQVEEYRKKFDKLRSGDSLKATAKKLVQMKNLAPAYGGNEDKATDAVVLMLRKDPRYNYGKRVDEREKLFATKTANMILIAFLTNHKADGLHDLSRPLEERMLTPTEEKNIGTEMDKVFAELFDTPSEMENITHGFYGRLEAVDALKDALSDDFSMANLDALDYAKPADGMRAIHATVTMARAYMLLHPDYRATAPAAPEGPMEIELKNRIRIVAARIEHEWFKRYHAKGSIKRPAPAPITEPEPPAGKPHRGEIKDFEHFTPAGLGLLLDAMKITGVKERVLAGPPLPIPAFAPPAEPELALVSPDLMASLNHILSPSGRKGN